MATIKYHFLRADMRSGAGFEPPWTIGETRTLAGKIVPCSYGYHASPTPWDALQYAPGPVLCAVTLDGEVPHGKPIDKFAGSARTLVAAVNIKRELHLFAADCAERVLPLYESECPKDQTPRLTIQAARDFANGLIDREQLEAAKSGAWDSTWDAAARAAWHAAWHAAAGAAARAAWDAARAARVARPGEHRRQRATFNALCIALLEPAK